MTTSSPFSLLIIDGPLTCWISDQLSERDLHTVGRRHGHAGQRLGTAAILRGVAHTHWKALAPFNRQHQVRFAHGHFNDVLDCAYRDAIARGGLTIDTHVEIRRSGDLLGVDIDGTRDAPQHLGDGPRPLFEGREIMAKDLHARLPSECRW